LPWALWREKERKRRRGLFDAKFYLAKYPDVAEAGLDPLQHYVLHGAAEGRKPHRLFDPEYYLRQRPEARAAGVDPLVDFLEGGARFANPHPLFDCAGDANALLEFVAAGRSLADAAGPAITISNVTAAISPAAREPHQSAFFEAVREDQLLAQIAGSAADDLAPSKSR
jgi:hypothetical protein